MTRLFLLCLAFVVASGPHAQANPWTRAEGDWFTALSYEALRDPAPAPRERRGFASLYAERGLGTRRSVIFDAGLGERSDDWTATALLKQELGRADATDRFAYSVGLGARGDAQEYLLAGRKVSGEPVAEAALHYGRGHSLGGLPGWLAADARLRYRTLSEDEVYKIDATLGTRFSNDALMFVQTQLSKFPGQDVGTRLSLSYVQPLTNVVSVEVSGLIGVGERDASGVKLGIWAEF